MTRQSLRSSASFSCSSSSSVSTPVCTLSSGMKPYIHVEDASMITMRSCSGPLLTRTEYREVSSLEVVSSTVKFGSNTSATTRWSMALVSMLTVPVFHSRPGTTVTTGRPSLSPSKRPSREPDELLSAWISSCRRSLSYLGKSLSQRGAGVDWPHDPSQGS